jgi:UDP-N-acetyl-D-glucosamine dehydrogenase
MTLTATIACKTTSAHPMRDAFLAKCADKTMTVGIIGMGYVGLPLALAFRAKGYPVIGFDVDQSKITALAANQSYIKHISGDRIMDMKADGKFDATVDFSRLKEVDAILICVPTPLNEHREPDLSYVVATTEVIGKHLRPNQIVILESTTYPGTSEEVMWPILEKLSGLKCGVEFALAYSPEREDPGNPDFDTTTIPKVVGANTADERAMAEALYSAFTKVVTVSDLRTAEAVKLTENIFRLVNIAHVNELKAIFAGMDIDVWEVIRAAATKPFGFMPFYPGPGLGGHCIPIDPFYLTWKARTFGQSTRFIELAGEIVSRLPRNVIESMAEALSLRQSKAVNGAKVLVLGLAYKKNVDDMRESPSLELITILRQRKADVDYHDPYIKEVPFDRHHVEFAGMKSVTLSPVAIAAYDCVLIATDHDSVDYDMVLENAKLVVDTRNAMATKPEHLRANVVKA